MNTVHFPTSVQTSSPRRLRARRSQPGQPLLWIAGALGLAVIIFTVALVLGRLLQGDAVAVAAEIEPAVVDPFYQQKLDAKVEELPAQF